MKCISEPALSYLCFIKGVQYVLLVLQECFFYKHQYTQISWIFIFLSIKKESFYIYVYNHLIKPLDFVRFLEHKEKVMMIGGRPRHRSVFEPMVSC